jgi:hypothetical protein
MRIGSRVAEGIRVERSREYLPLSRKREREGEAGATSYAACFSRFGAKRE